MIGYLKGTVIDKKLPEVWVEVGGVGYRVRVGVRAYETLVIGEPAEVYIHTHLRQDALELFGFKERAELELFELLLTVSGIGPKIALAIVGTQKVDRVEKAIREADVAFFTLIPGIGKKGAQRIIVDLKGKIGSIKELDLQSESGVDDDVTLALMQFGFKREEIRVALKEVDENLTDAEKVKAGLKRLGRK